MMLNSDQGRSNAGWGHDMPNSGEERTGPRSRLEAQLDLILNGFHGEGGLPDAAIWPPDWNHRDKDNVDYADYLYRNHHILVRDEDVVQVREVVDSEPVRDRSSNLRGLTLLRLSDPELQVEDACTTVDRELGEGIATPDHIFYVCTTGTCPATEPEPVPGSAAPDPDVETGPCDGHGVCVAALDRGPVG